MSKRTPCVCLLNIKLDPLWDFILNFFLLHHNFWEAIRTRSALHIYWDPLRVDLCNVFNLPCFLLTDSSGLVELRKLKRKFHQPLKHPISWDCPHKKEIIINLDIYLHALRWKGFFFPFASCLASCCVAFSPKRLKAGVRKKCEEMKKTYSKSKHTQASDTQKRVSSI